MQVAGLLLSKGKVGNRGVGLQVVGGGRWAGVKVLTKVEI